MAVIAGRAYADQGGAGHTSLVPEDPRLGFDQVVNGEIHSIAVVGDVIVVGGDFTTVRLADGTEISQPNVAAFDMDTGEFLSRFRPIVSGKVISVHESFNEGHVYIGGTFKAINGVRRNRFAELSLAHGSATDFLVEANSRVQAIETFNGRLFVGGLFTRIGSEPVERLAEIDPATGLANPAFDFDFQGQGSEFLPRQNIQSIRATPNGQRLIVVHGAYSIDGEGRRGVAMFDVSNPAAPSLTPFTVHDYWDGSINGSWVTSGDVSPDGSFFVVGTSGGDHDPWLDMVLAWPVTDQPNPAPRWVHSMRDSVYSVAITSQAVYAGGHFCRIDAGPGPTVVEGDDTQWCSGSPEGEGAWRKQLAALSLGDGTPLDWDPGSNSVHGVLAMTATPRGLLVGHDGTYINGRQVGRLGFFDFQLDDSDAPIATITSPVDGALLPSPAKVTGIAADNISVDRVKIRVKDRTTGFWLQADNTFAAPLHEFVIPTPKPADADTPWAQALPVLADGPYRVEARAVDLAGNVSVAAVHLFDVGEPDVAHTCEAVRTGDSITLTWSAIPGEAVYAVRRNGTFLAHAHNTLTYVDAGLASGTYSYVIRSQQDGEQTNVVCEPTALVVP
ncbi:MAG: hypothetical protein HKN26_11510 [Acidimicrobiales bacterium]|nr:hypothetical protein [Acidimicrobiales bacterium]